MVCGWWWVDCRCAEPQPFGARRPQLRVSDSTTGDSEIEWAKNGAITDGGFEMWLHEYVQCWVGVVGDAW
jgi:hypothetical protein